MHVNSVNICSSEEINESHGKCIELMEKHSSEKLNNKCICQ